MFKAGEKVILKYPERSAWDDTERAIRDGTLIRGKVYQVATDSNNGGIDTRLVIQGEGTRYSGWILSTVCLVSVKQELRRKLPDWF